ncbi:MAG: Uma2 family endonuclease [Blastocatellia bacterium]
MASQPQSYITPEQYLELERKADHVRSEYFNGEIFAMAGASRRHILIITNLVIQLGAQCKKRPCEVYSTDMRLRVSPTGLYTYPDVIVMCGEPIFADDQNDTLLNPTLIIEVLSDSTKDYDRGGKFEHYRKIESFKEYVLIAQDKPHVEDFIRQPDNRWMFSETNNLQDTIELASVNCHLALSEIYDKVGLPSD